MKKILALCAAVAAAFCLTGASGGTKTPLDVAVNLYTPADDYMYMANIEMEGLPFTADGTAMASVRALAAYLHLNLFFGNGLFDSTGHAGLMLSDGRRWMEFGVFENDRVYCGDADGFREDALPVSTLMVDGRMYVPVKYVAEYFGFTVTQDVPGARFFSPYREGSGSGLVVSNFSVLGREDLNVTRGGSVLNLFDDYPLEFVRGDKTSGGISLGDSVEKVRGAYGREMYEKTGRNGGTELCYGTLSSPSDVSQIRLLFTFDRAGTLQSLETKID